LKYLRYYIYFTPECNSSILFPAFFVINSIDFPDLRESLLQLLFKKNSEMFMKKIRVFDFFLKKWMFSNGRTLFQSSNLTPQLSISFYRRQSFLSDFSTQKSYNFD